MVLSPADGAHETFCCDQSLLTEELMQVIEKARIVNGSGFPWRSFCFPWRSFCFPGRSVSFPGGAAAFPLRSRTFRRLADAAKAHGITVARPSYLIVPASAPCWLGLRPRLPGACARPRRFSISATNAAEPSGRPISSLRLSGPKAS